MCHVSLVQLSRSRIEDDAPPDRVGRPFSSTARPDPVSSSTADLLRSIRPGADPEPRVSAALPRRRRHDRRETGANARPVPWPFQTVPGDLVSAGLPVPDMSGRRHVSTSERDRTQCGTGSLVDTGLPDVWD